MGGGLLVENGGRATVTKCAFTGNRSQSGGGGILVRHLLEADHDLHGGTEPPDGEGSAAGRCGACESAGKLPDGLRHFKRDVRVEHLEAYERVTARHGRHQQCGDHAALPAGSLAVSHCHSGFSASSSADARTKPYFS